MGKRERQKESVEIKHFLSRSFWFFFLGVLLMHLARTLWGDDFARDLGDTPLRWPLAYLLGGTLVGGWYASAKCLSKGSENGMIRASIFDAQLYYFVFMLGGPVIFYPLLIKKLIRLRELKNQDENDSMKL